jgi:APA family basic amino acid/polyamine antiporter
MGERPQLLRALTLVDATMIVMGSMIGSGIFMTSAESMRLLPAPGWLLLAWTLAGVLTITGALCCAELAAMFPRAGGQYVFLREAYGPLAGFLFGWALFLVVQTGTIAAVGVAFANFLAVFLPSFGPDHYLVAPVVFGPYAISLSYQQMVAIAVILFLTFMNTGGLQVGKFVQNLFTFTKTAALIGLIAACWFWGRNPDGALFTAPFWRPEDPDWRPALFTGQTSLALATAMLLGRAMVGPMFAQSAWNNVTFTAAEVRDPERNLPRALWIGCGAIVVLYLLTNVGYVMTLPVSAIARAPGNRVAAAALSVVWGDTGVKLISIAIMISTFGCANGLILAGARVYYAMARDGLFIRGAGRLNSRHVPAIALIIQGLWASALVLPRTVDASGQTPVFGNVYVQLFEYVISADLIFYALMIGAVIVLRHRRPELSRPYRTLGYPFVPLLYLVIDLAMVIDLAYLMPRTAGLGYLIVLSGIPAYLLWRTVNRFSQPQAQA